MKKINVDLELYEYEELVEEAKQKAFDEHFTFLCETGEYESDDEVIDAVEDSIEANNYLFFYDGTMAHTTTYVGGHEKAGTTELKFQNRIYDITGDEE